MTTGDPDGDGDIDVVAVDRTTNRIVTLLQPSCASRQRGLWLRRVVTSDAMRRRRQRGRPGQRRRYGSLPATDGDNTIAWYENTDGSGRTFAKRIVTQSVDHPLQFLADVDADGWLDLLGAGAG